MESSRRRRNRIRLEFVAVYRDTLRPVQAKCERVWGRGEGEEVTIGMYQANQVTEMAEGCRWEVLIVTTVWVEE